jgi:cupin 2 domain-containing protein
VSADPLKSGDLFTDVPARLEEEETTILAELPGARVERIVSTGQASPEGFWYDQGWTEWVVVLTGSAGVRIEGEAAARMLGPGAWLEIPPHARHRVDWTDADEPTVWLAVHAK